PSPPPLPAEPARELTTLEYADILLAEGQAERAAEVYQDHLRESPDDAEAQRSLAVALLEAGRPQQAVAVAAMAYDTDPTLAMRPIPRRLFDGPMDLRRALNSAVGHANRVNT